MRDPLPIPQTISDVLTYPSGRLAKMRSNEDRDEFVLAISHLPILQPYDEWGNTLIGDEVGRLIRERYARALLSLAMEPFPRPEDIYKDFIPPALPTESDPQRQIVSSDDYRQLPYRAVVHVEFVLDASGNMKDLINGRSKIEIAKEAVRNLVQELPPDVQVSLRAFGHKPAPDKTTSCQMSELLYPLSPYRSDAFQKALDQVTPNGWTSLAHSIRLAGDDLKPFSGDQYTNIVVIVSDGAETCGGDPIQEAEALKNSAIQPFFHLIGFDADAEGQKQLASIAQAVQGVYRDATDAESLKNELKPLQEWISGWEVWRQKAFEKAKAYRKEMVARIEAAQKEWDRAAERLQANLAQLDHLAVDYDKVKRYGSATSYAENVLYNQYREGTFYARLKQMKPIYFQSLLVKLDKDFSDILREIDRTYETQNKTSQP